MHRRLNQFGGFLQSFEIARTCHAPDRNGGRQSADLTEHSRPRAHPAAHPRSMGLGIQEHESFRGSQANAGDRLLVRFVERENSPEPNRPGNVLVQQRRCHAEMPFCSERRAAVCSSGSQAKRGDRIVEQLHSRESRPKHRMSGICQVQRRDIVGEQRMSPASQRRRQCRFPGASGPRKDNCLVTDQHGCAVERHQSAEIAKNGQHGSVNVSAQEKRIDIGARVNPNMISRRRHFEKRNLCDAKPGSSVVQRFKPIRTGGRSRISHLEPQRP